MSKAWAGGSTSRWRRLRAAILEENQRVNGGRCQAALGGVCTGWAEQAHHTKGRAVTGDDPRFIIATCRACNLKLGDVTATSPEPRPVTKW